MSYHVIDISTEGSVVSVKHSQLVCRQKDGVEHTVPLEDVGAVVVNAFSVLLHNSFLSATAEHKIAVVICEKFKPRSIVLPVQRGSDTLLTRAQITTPQRVLDSLWGKTVDSKVVNQYDFASELRPGDPLLTDLFVALKRRDLSKEGNCARLYWTLFSRALGIKDFKRIREGDGLNACLNYGYGVLVSRILQKLLAYGLDPMYGIGHVVRERSMPLAYDLMEPFRVAIDRAVYAYVKQQIKEDRPLVVDTPFKKAMHTVMTNRFSYREARDVPLEDIVDMVMKSLRTAFISHKVSEYRPWTRRSSRWDG